MSTLSDKKYLFHIVEENSSYFNKNIAIYITPTYFWDEYNTIADHYTDEELEELCPVLEELGLAEVTVSTYESVNSTNEEKLKNKLLKAGFIESDSFSDYIDSFKDTRMWYDDDDFDNCSNDSCSSDSYDLDEDMN